MNGNEVIYELQKSLGSALHTVEDLQDKIVSLQFSLIGVKSQTAKEFAERLKAKAHNPERPWEDSSIRESDIDEVLKEMEVSTGKLSSVIKAVEEFSRKVQYFFVDEIMFDDWSEECKLIEYMNSLVEEMKSNHDRPSDN